MVLFTQAILNVGLPSSFMPRREAPLAKFP